MLNKLVRKKNIIIIAYVIVLLSLWVMSLVWGNREDKTMVLVLSLITPFMVYGFVRLLYKVVNTNASPKVMRFFYWLFLAGGTLGIIMMIVEYVNGFPNGLSPTLGACGGMIAATLDKAKKNIEPDANRES